MKLIGITQRVDFIEDRDEIRFSLDQNMIRFVESCNFLSASIPNNSVYLDEWLNKIEPSGIILSGGNNIGEYLERDCTEERLIWYCEKNSIPLLGICRGMQLLATKYGSSLVKVINHIKKNHQIYGKINKTVNSYHGYSIDNCPNSFNILARAKNDHTIEAIRHENLPWEGWMWHPERVDPFDENDKIRFKNLFS